MPDAGEVLAWGPQYQERRKNRGGDNGNECVICGRKTSAKRLFAQVNDAGEFLDPTAEDDDSMGFFPVGIECAQKLPQGYAVAVQ